VGSEIEIKYDLIQTTIGVPGSGTYQFSVPSGITIDLIKNPVHSLLGKALLSSELSSEAGASSSIGSVHVWDSTHFYVKFVSPVEAGTSLE
jgi:hypothetical protein